MRALAAAPMCAVSACGCRNEYPKPQIQQSALRRGNPAPILMPARLSGQQQLTRAAGSVVDAHAHFFNASDVPIRGFIEESIGHNSPDWLQPLIKEMAKLAEDLADRAPTAAEELTSLDALSEMTRTLGRGEIQTGVEQWFQRERAAAAQRVVDVVGGTGFERSYRAMVPQLRRGSDRLTPEEVLGVVAEAQDPRALSVGDSRSKAAKAKLEFLFYMLSMRAANVRTYIEAFSPDDGSFGVDMVLGALVDFDYWLDCPPRSAHDDQVALHQHLATMHGGYMRPVVAYNPWTDIEQNGAALKRVRDAWASGMFVGVKIYPPTGFLPAANATTAVDTKKRRPDLQRLDDALGAFFTLCAQERIPVIAHAAHSNGRDAAHDEFSGPTSWERLLRRVVADTKTPIISLGHFGGDNPGTNWTRQFADLMKGYPTVRLFGDLGYWDHLMCENPNDCTSARNRLKDVLRTPVGEAEAVGDRVMFATDWLMLSQVSNWRTYPQHVREGLEAIAGSQDVAKILGGNARTFFARIAT